MAIRSLLLSCLLLASSCRTAAPVRDTSHSPDCCALGTGAHDTQPEVRAFLLHITHYDPEWNRTKEKEQDKPFDLKLAFDLVDAMAQAKMNLLIIDIADGVEFKSHPELKRPYSRPMAELKSLADHARSKGIDVAPKLNFSKSPFFTHNHWLRPYHDKGDTKEYWAKAFEVVDEVISVTQPRQFFHVGMDEDQDRSVPEYVAAVKTLRDGLHARGLTTVMWNDADEPNQKAIKAWAALPQLPRDVVQVPWAYHRVPIAVLEHLHDLGFPIWGAPGVTPAEVVSWREQLLRVGGTGLLLTRWVPCIEENREALLKAIRTLGPLYAGQ